jgi:OmpA-OmpF porin, OOP family
MPDPTVTRWLCGAATAVAIGLSAPAALAQPAAQEGFALPRFRPAPPGDRMLGVESPYVAGDLAPHAMLLFDYAHNPLVLVREGQGDLGSVVTHQLLLHAAGALALFSRVGINLDVPLALVQAGGDPSAEGAGTFASPSSVQIGDIRVGLRARLLGGYFDPLQIAIGAYLWLPTGSSEVGSFVGDGTARGMPLLITGGRTERVVWSTSIGVEIRPSHIYGQVTQGSMLHVGVGAGVLLGAERRIQVGPELTFATVLEDMNRRTLNMELLVSGKYRFLESFEAGAGVGPGLTSGVGTPDVRAVAMLAYTPKMERRPQDRDKDGIFEPEDACPDTRGVASADPKANGCPPPLPMPKDSDDDGIIDDVDACPEVAGAPSEDAEENGCPPDQDGDEVADAEDACPDVAGVKTDDAATNGCPGDTDGDTIRDDQDACPQERGKPDPDPEKNGCPKDVRVTEQEIVILQQVQFDTGTAVIKAASNSLLNEVAEVIKGHAEVVKLEIQGHTDNVGQFDFNMKLSQQRADAVMLALIERGVEAGRLVAKGYGASKPIGDNRTERGRRQNRRVQFKILEKAPPK